MGRIDLQRPHKDEQSSSLDCPGRHPQSKLPNESVPTFDPTMYQIHKAPIAAENEDVMVISNERAEDESHSPMTQSKAPPTLEQTPPTEQAPPTPAAVNQQQTPPTADQTLTSPVQSCQSPSPKQTPTQATNQQAHAQTLKNIRVQQDNIPAHPNLLPPPPQVRRQRFTEAPGGEPRVHPADQTPEDLPSAESWLQTVAKSST